MKNNKLELEVVKKKIKSVEQFEESGFDYLKLVYEITLLGGAVFELIIPKLSLNSICIEDATFEENENFLHDVFAKINLDIDTKIGVKYYMKLISE